MATETNILNSPWKKKPQTPQTKHSVKGIFCPYLDLKTAGEKPSLSDFVEIFV